MNDEKKLSKDARAIIVAIVMATVAIIGINKNDISDLRTEMRDLRTEMRAEMRDVRNLLVTHITGHSHNEETDSVADARGLQE